MQFQLSIAYLILLGLFTSPEKVHNKLQRVYDKNPAKCEVFAKKWVGNNQKEPAAYYFLSKIYFDKYLAADKLASKYTNLSRAITYGYRVQKSDSSLLFAKYEWAILRDSINTDAKILLTQLRENEMEEKADLLTAKVAKLESEKRDQIRLVTQPKAGGEELKTPLFKGGEYFGLASGLEVVPSFSEEAEKELVAILNKARKQKGMQELIWEEDLAKAARYHAYDLATQDYFSHSTYDRIDGELVLIAGAFDRIRKFYTKGFVNSENVAGGNKSAEHTYNQWYNSPGHYKNMFNPSSLKVGVGVFYDENSTYGYYWAFCTALE